MPNQERTFEAGGRTYAIRFTQNALFRLERELGRPLHLALRNLGVVEIQAMLWAGLEGARLKHLEPGATKPFTLDQAGDLIDALGGIAAAMPIVVDAWRAAMPTQEGSGDPSPGPSPVAMRERAGVNATDGTNC